MRGLLDTSILIAQEQGRSLGGLPDETAVSVVTLAELHAGVLMADDDRTRAQRLATLLEVERTFDPIPIDAAVARAFALLHSQAKRAGRRPRIMDTLIAATAFASDLPVYTKDAGFEDFDGVRVVRV